MHDGHFNSLEEVIDFYDRDVKDTPDLDGRLRVQFSGPAKVLNLTATEKSHLKAFLEALTDSTFLKTEKFSDPFASVRLSLQQK